MKRMLLATLPALALLVMGASPHQGFDLQAAPASPASRLGPLSPPARGVPQAERDYAPAPIPNRNVDAPAGPRDSNDPRISPTIISRSSQYRGETLDRKSSAQGEQERNLVPGAGFKLRMPLTPQP